MLLKPTPFQFYKPILWFAACKPTQYPITCYRTASSISKWPLIDSTCYRRTSTPIQCNSNIWAKVLFLELFVITRMFAAKTPWTWTSSWRLSTWLKRWPQVPLVCPHTRTKWTVLLWCWWGEPVLRKTESIRQSMTISSSELLRKAIGLLLILKSIDFFSTEKTKPTTPSLKYRPWWITRRRACT